MSTRSAVPACAGSAATAAAGRSASAATARQAAAPPSPRIGCVQRRGHVTKDRASFAQLARILPGGRPVPVAGRGGNTVRSRLNLDRPLPALALGAVLALGLLGCNNSAGSLLGEP